MNQFDISTTYALAIEYTLNSTVHTLATSDFLARHITEAGFVE